MKYCLDRKQKRTSQEKLVSLKVVAPSFQSGSDVIQVEFKQQLNAKKRQRQRRFGVVLISIMMLMILPMVRDGIAYYRYQQQYELLEKENAELLAIQAELQKDLTSLDDPAVIEKLARENLGMVLPGESKIYQAIPTADIPKPEKLQAGEMIH